MIRLTKQEKERRIAYSGCAQMRRGFYGVDLPADIDLSALCDQSIGASANEAADLAAR
jgi:hypothetical protein